MELKGTSEDIVGFAVVMSARDITPAEKIEDIIKEIQFYWGNNPARDTTLAKKLYINSTKELK